jgi:disease resistance protein RPM1
MDVLAGAMGNLAPKLLQLLQDEYNLTKELKEQVKSVSKEMKFIKAALEKLGEGRPDQLDPQLRIWSGEVRESLYDMEDVVDVFLVRVEGAGDTQSRLKRSTEWMGQLFSKVKARHNIATSLASSKTSRSNLRR